MKIETKIRIIGGTIIIMLFGVLLSLLIPRLHLAANCNAQEIELKDVTPAKCYADFSPKFCPIPKNLQCSIKIKTPLITLLGIG